MIPFYRSIRARRPGTLINCLNVMMLLAIVSILAWTEETVGAQTSHDVILRVTTVAMIRLQDLRPLVLTIDSSGSSEILPGMSPTGTNRLCYTVVNAPEMLRTILVQWAPTDAAPPGTSLHVCALSIPNGCGVAAGEVTIGSAPQALITAIPSCATGTGDTGVELRYRFVMDEPARSPTEAERTVTILFTISDDP